MVVPRVVGSFWSLMSLGRSRYRILDTRLVSGALPGSAARPPPEPVRQLRHLGPGPVQVGGPRQHALEDRLTIVGQAPDRRDIALDASHDRGADLRPVTGVSVGVQ